MKQLLKRDRASALLALLALLASLLPLAERVRAEETNKYYDYILDYTSVRAMALQSSKTEDEWLSLFFSLGVDKIALNEASAANLHQNAAIPVHAMTVKTATEQYGWEQSYPEKVAAWLRGSTDMSDAIICTETAEDYAWILDAFRARFDDFEAQTYFDGEKGFLFIRQQANGLKGEKLLELRLGIWPATVEKMRAIGYQIVPRSVTVKDMNGTSYAAAYIEVLERYDSPYFLNSGDELVGSESGEGKALLRAYLESSGASIGMFEQSDQSQNDIWPGTVELLEETGYRGVRVFNEWAYIQNRYQYCGYDGPEEITNTFFRAIAERNCKVIFLKMILDPDSDVSWGADESGWIYITDPAEYEKMLGDLETRLAPLGYTRATVPAMTLDAPSTALQLLQGIGTAALFVLLLDMILCLGRRWRAALLALGVLGFAGLCLLKPAAYRLILSMAGGIVMPSLAAAGLCRVLAQRRREEPRLALGRLTVSAIVTALTTVAVSLSGALLASSALSQLSYILEIDLYRGVKLMQLIPIALFALCYLLVYAYEETGARDAVLARMGARGEKGRAERFLAYFRELMRTPMQLGWFLAAVVLAVAAVFLLAVFVYYIYRTGNSSSTSAAELQFRNFLENLLIARPRTKEMLIGWPMLLLFIWSVRRGLRFLPMLFGLGMSIGLVSVVNTFLHIRTPFLLSLLRTFWGLLFGLLLGLVLMLVMELLYRLVRRICGVDHV